MRKAALHNLGCKVNAYETEAMQQLLEEAGYEIVPFQEKADVYVINTCSVTNIADRKSRQMLHRAKKMNPDAVVVAAGCYVQAAGEELKKDAAIDVIIGNNRKKDLVPLLDEYFAGKHVEEDSLIDIGKTREYEALHINKIADHTRAFIKIQDGCNQFCSYCIIPYTRGRVRSRKPEEIMEEIKGLVDKGYREVVLTGIHLSSYGLDLDGITLLDLMVKIDKIQGLERLRLGSLEPRIVTEEFTRTLAGLRTICPHFHLSLQSGCDATLKRMNRRYTTEEYEKGCQILRKYFDRPAITTDVIVGFPQETEEEFAQTIEFLKRIHFYEMHVFKYSRRAGTRAADMPGQLTENQKGQRSDVLLKLDQEMSLEYRKSFLGEEKEVLMEEKIVIDGTEYLVGHTREYVKAAIPWEEGKKGAMITGTMASMLNDEVFLLG
ncbi:tRNA (N(6)-L-threonylcarbamoyladenosine(37)-C(2))-methylthiotransferase MtaB [Lachnospiraceae bacterium HCP1S3_A8]|nr:tRNA (N(6)-L-threonylcarbamoyladenosine(37)-C(2))-methylthiotransferase MtaB [Lachnospiraceae bacterium]